MHSVANLATLQTPLATFFPSKKCPNLVSENHRYCRTSTRSCSPSARAHLSLSLCVCSASLPACAHTSLSPSLSASAQFLSQCTQHTPLSLSLRLLSFSPSAHIHLSLCASAQFLSQRAHTSLSLSLRLLSFSSASGREEQRFS